MSSQLSCILNFSENVITVVLHHFRIKQGHSFVALSVPPCSPQMPRHGDIYNILLTSTSYPFRPPVTQHSLVSPVKYHNWVMRMRFHLFRGWASIFVSWFNPNPTTLLVSNRLSSPLLFFVWCFLIYVVCVSDYGVMFVHCR